MHHILAPRVNAVQQRSTLVMELLNDGKYEEELPYYFDLVSRGHPVAPVGVSDSHGSENGTGVNRTYVNSGSADSADVTQALLAGQTVVSLGPYIHANIAGAWAPGKTYVGAQVLEAEVFAPSWVEVNRWTLYENGEVVESGEFTGESLQLDLAPTQDAFYNLSVAGDSSMQDAYNEIPWAMTSAIKVDLNGVCIPVFCSR